MTERRPFIRFFPLDLPLGMFALSAFVAIWPAYDRSLCWNTLLTLLAGFLLYVTISRLAVSRRRWLAMAAFVVLTGVLLSIDTIAQYPDLAYAGKAGLISRLSAFLAQVIPSPSTWTPVGNSAATYLEGLIFLAAALTLTFKRNVWRIVGVAGVLLMALGLLTSTSRGAWVGVLLASAVWATLYWRPARWGIAGGALLLTGMILYVILQGDVTALNDIPILNRTLAPIFIRPDRLEVYRNSVYLIQDFPLTGIGLGEQFAMTLSRYALLIQVPFLTYSHNLYLQVWLEQGLLGIVAWLWTLAVFYQATFTYSKRGPDLLYQATWLGLTANLLHGFTDARQYVDLWCWLPCFALLGLNAAIVSRRSRRRPRQWRWPISAGVALLFLIVVLVSLHPLPAAWHANQGCVLQARGDLSDPLTDVQRTDLRREAEARYRQAIHIASLNRTAQQRLGLILVDQNRFQEAVEHLALAQQADPHNTTTHKGLALAYVWTGELEKARPLLQDVPDIVQELNTWGWWRSTQDQIEQSINAYRISLLLAPEQPEVRERVEQLEKEFLE
ncbi:MAG TPA: tetratricopeptide repeat protein [Chloroflexi bacterium]|nr:tetratricopeptide repeat protein [Chloroflexota bacterium]